MGNIMKLARRLARFMYDVSVYEQKLYEPYVSSISENLSLFRTRDRIWYDNAEDEFFFEFTEDSLSDELSNAIPTYCQFIRQIPDMAYANELLQKLPSIPEPVSTNGIINILLQITEEEFEIIERNYGFCDT